MLQQAPGPAPERRPFVGTKTPAGRLVTLAFAGIILAAAGLLFWQNSKSHGGAGTTALLQYGDPAQQMEIPLNTDKTYDIESNGYTIHLQVKDGAIAFVNSPCPDHTCESFGTLKNAGDWAACLPAKATLTVESPAG